MSLTSAATVLLADRHHGLYEGIRGLLETTFARVFLVTDKPSLMEGAIRLQPSVILLDLYYADGHLAALIRELRRHTPTTKLLLLSVHDEPSIIESARAAGADGLIVKRAIASDLMTAIDEVQLGRSFFPAQAPQETQRANLWRNAPP
jgi:DNA-binding NarL/FixJ family response regulator